jgi:hypothetical protein
MENGQKQDLPALLNLLSEQLRNDGRPSFLLSQTPSEVRGLIKLLVELQNTTNAQLVKESFLLQIYKLITFILSLTLLGVLSLGMK